MNKNLVVFLGLLFISTCVFAQIEDEDTGHHHDTIDIQEHEIHDSSHHHIGGDQHQEVNPEDLMKDEGFKERIRNLYVACIVTSRHKLNSYGDELTGLLKAVTDRQSQQALYKKILAEYIYACANYGTQNPTTPDEIIKSLQDKTFKISDWDIIFMQIDIDKFKDPSYPVELTEEESNILKFVDQFDEAMKQNSGKQGAEGGAKQSEEEDDSIPNLFGQQTSEPMIGTLSLSSISKSAQFLYIFVIIALIGAVVGLGYMKIANESAGPKIKNKKDKKKQ